MCECNNNPTLFRLTFTSGPGVYRSAPALALILLQGFDLDIYKWKDCYFIAIQNFNFVPWIVLDGYGLKYHIRLPLFN